ncbi:SseB family protein [Streptococcus caprae]|uniref:SseB family protein n=1 Tax=Streptococcus caprae TaxID=1640501 RepID=A0ABV8CWS2_9STRE
MKELDRRLREFIARPDDFLVGICFIAELHANMVFAPAQPFEFPVGSQRVTPVFTNRTDFESFKLDERTVRNQDWTQRSVLEVLTEAVNQGFSGLAFNLKKRGDFSNSTIFKSADLITLMNYYNDLLNQVLGEANQARELEDKVYFVPAFVTQTGPQTSTRRFPSFAMGQGQTYLPVFTNLASLEAWARTDNGRAFSQAKGAILAWSQKDIEHPLSGHNRIEGLAGIVINPLDDAGCILWQQ